jgi:23S rRNA (cytidine1920-2'-O)/16S rRNA (cytidine1409-2'-O)-methyltransferase
MPPTLKPKKQRLDVLVHERGLAESRAKAQALILAGQVVVKDQRVDKPGALVPDDAELRLKGEVLPYVSRGGLKLKHAIDTFGLEVKGAICADIGASTGGFTDCLLQEGATKVFAIDVGYAQLHDKLRRDPRVISKERVNARYLGDEELPEPLDVVVIDVSFISVKQVLPAVLPKLRPGGMLIALVKPQFEAGREHIGKGGVVRDPQARAEAIEGVRAWIVEQGFTVLGLSDSPVPGPAGNVEALLVARR